MEGELNIRDVVFSTNEVETGVGYKAEADWPTLGKKLKKDLGKVRSGLPKLTSDEIKVYSETGSMTVNGIDLAEGDLVVSRFVDLKGAEGLATNTDGDVVIILDVQNYPELEIEALSREFINRCQRLRKEAGLQATDDVDVFYNFEAGEGVQDILAAIITHAANITKTIRSAPANVKDRPVNAPVLIERLQEINETKFTLSLVRR